MLAKKLIPTLPTTLEKAKMTDFCKRKTPQSATFQNILYEETRELSFPRCFVVGFLNPLCGS